MIFKKMKRSPTLSSNGRNRTGVVRACILSSALLFSPAALIGDPAGPPDGLDVKVVNIPLPVTGEIDATVTGEVTVTNFPPVQEIVGEVDATVTNFPEVQEVTGIVAVEESTNAVFVDGKICPKTIDDFVAIDFDIPEDMVLILEDVTFEVVRCLGDEGTSITPNQITAELGGRPLGQLSSVVIGPGPFIGRAFNKQVKRYFVNSFSASLRIEPADYISGFFFTGYGRLVPGTRTIISD